MQIIGKGNFLVLIILINRLETRILAMENGNSIWKLEFQQWKMEIPFGN